MSVDPPSSPFGKKNFRDKPLTAADLTDEEIDPSPLPDSPAFGEKKPPALPVNGKGQVDIPPGADKPGGAPLLPDDPAEQLENRRSLRRYRKSDTDEDKDTEEAESEILLLSALLRRLVEKKLSGPEEVEAKPKNNRFVSRANSPGAGPAVETLPTSTQAPPSMKMKPRTEQGANTTNHWPRSNPALVKWILCAALLCAFGTFTYLIGRNAGSAAVSRTTRNRPVAAPVGVTPTWSAKTISMLDAALAADQAGDLKTAMVLANELRQKMPGTTSLDLYLSTLGVRQGDFDDTEERIVKLSDAFTPPLEAAAVNEALGFIYARHRDLPRAASSFQDAAATDPFNPRHFQHWAEALRRQGQLQEAVDHFRQALARLPVGQPGVASQRSEIELKINLSQIESGKDDDVKTAIDTRLKDSPVSGYWLLTAAAYALQHGDAAGAAVDLLTARATLSADVYAALTNDYFFHNFAHHKEVESLLPVDTPAARQTPFLPQMGYFLDP